MWDACVPSCPPESTFGVAISFLENILWVHMTRFTGRVDGLRAFLLFILCLAPPSQSRNTMGPAMFPVSIPWTILDGLVLFGTSFQPHPLANRSCFYLTFDWRAADSVWWTFPIQSQYSFAWDLKAFKYHTKSVWIRETMFSNRREV